MREREYNMDYLRIFACFMVIFLHVAAQNWSSVDVTLSTVERDREGL